MYIKMHDTSNKVSESFEYLRLCKHLTANSVNVGILSSVSTYKSSKYDISTSLWSELLEILLVISWIDVFVEFW